MDDVFRDRWRDQVIGEVAAVILVELEEQGVVLDLDQAAGASERLMNRGFLNPVPF